LLRALIESGSASVVSPNLKPEEEKDDE